MEGAGSGQWWGGAAFERGEEVVASLVKRSTRVSCARQLQVITVFSAGVVR